MLLVLWSAGCRRRQERTQEPARVLPAPEDARPKYATLEDAYRAIAPIVCGELIRSHELSTASRRDCEELRLPRVWGDPANDNLAHALRAGRVRLDVAKIERCLARAGDTGTDTECFSRWEILRPAVAEGGACLTSGECVSGKCQGASSFGYRCLGTCAAVPKGGDTCSWDGDCSGGDFCNESKHCAARKTVGAACADQLGVECAEGAYCNMKRICAPLLPEGARCVHHFIQCRDGLTCDAYRTERCIRPKALGESCTSTTMCAGGMVCRGLSRVNIQGEHLDVAGKCAPVSQLGEPCVFGTVSGCTKLDARCDLDTKTCVASRAVVGQSCEAYGCAFDYQFCNADKKCAPLAAEGAACDPLLTKCGVGECEPETRTCVLRSCAK